MRNSTLVKTLLVALLGLFVQMAFADNASNSKRMTTATNTKVSYRSLDRILPESVKVTNSSEYTLGAAPRENIEDGNRMYGPIAEYLSQVTGKKIVYRHSGAWSTYQGTMQKGGYDLVFDDAHFNGWRVTKIQHNMLVKVSGVSSYVTLIKKDNVRTYDVKQLAGYTICAPAPPHLGTLTLLEQFTNPARQPVIVDTEGWKNIYDSLLSGKCAAAMLPMAALEQLDKNGVNTRILYRAQPFPDSAFSAGPRLTAEDQAKIIQALLAPAAAGPTQALRQKYAGGAAFVPTTNGEYASLGEFLRNEWGYDR